MLQLVLIENPSELANFLMIFYYGLEGLAQKKLEDISSTLKLLEESSLKHITELKRQSVWRNWR